MSAFRDPPTPSPSPKPSTSSSLWKKPQQDVVKSTKSLSPPLSPPSIFLKVPKAPAGGIITPPPEAQAKDQHETDNTSSTVIDCPISQASFLLAQASLATALFGESSTTEFQFRSSGSPRTGSRKLRIGKGLDGCFSRTRGFLGGQETLFQNHVTARSNASSRSDQRLPPPLEAWESVHADLPRLLRAGRVRQAVDALGDGASEETDAWDDLEQRHLARAALVLSALAHAYMFGEEQGKGENKRFQLPAHVLSAWDKVCKALGRPLTGRVPADDVLNNAVGNDSFNLSSVYFGLPEERLSSGLQGRMEAVFAPALSAMALAQSGVLADQPDLVAHCLENLAARIVKCAHVFDAMTPRDTTRFDPVIWIKTYPAMGQAVTSGELGNSGVDVPLFHALDAFIGRKDVKGDLKGMQSDRRAKLPVNICAFLDALGNEAGSVRDYVAGACARLHYLSPDEQSQYRHLSAAWDGLLQMYVWFLERHRVKAVGVTGVSLSTGRHSTSSGVQSSDQDKCLTAGKPKMRPETMLSMQMKKGMASRLGGRPLWQDAYIQSQSVYEGTVVVTVRLDANLPLKSGDRVQVWPPRKRKNVKRTSSHQRRLRGSSPEDQDVSSEEGDDDVEPRFYSIARVIPDTEGRGMAITLTVGQHSPEGLVSSFLSNSAQGTHLRLRPWPSPRFRQPRDMTLPLVLIGQGSGIGPFVGFLHDRVAARHRLDDTQDDMGEMGEVLFVIAAKTLRHVPCPLDSLEELTKALPLTIILALSQETHQMIRSGVWTELPQGDRHVTSHLLEYRDFVQRLVKKKNGHVFVCGTSEFGATVMSDLGLDQTQQQQQRQKQQAKDLNDESYDNNRTQIPSPPDHWDQVHQDLFNAVKKPLISRSSSSPSSSPTDLKTPVISLSELAAHNSITSCWIAIDGIVYDMTSFLTTHPGGPKTLLESAGTIADARFAETHGGPHVQEIRGYLQRYTVGRLSTVTADSPGTQMTTSKIIDVLVKMQNALTNNATFEASRGPVPMYVYQDALLVFADGLDGVASILSDVSSDGISTELRETILKTQALLRRAFTVLKDGCKGFLVAAGSKGSRSRSSALLDESEDLIQRLHREPIQKVHSAIDACKKDLGEMKTGTNADCSCKNHNVHEDENVQVLRCALNEFCISLASVAEDLLY